MRLIPHKLASVHGPRVHLERILLLVHPRMVHLEDGRETGLDKGDPTNVEGKPVVGDGDDEGFKGLDLAPAREHLRIHVASIGEIPDCFWGCGCGGGGGGGGVSEAVSRHCEWS